MEGANNTYWGNVKEAARSLLMGLRLSIRHFFEAKKSRKPYGIHEDKYFEQQTGIFTVQYPKESIPVPDNGRYRLHNEIEDCIVCDKCAKICPVNCIEIEPIKAVEEIGKTSDGTPKRIHAAKFDIDMAKCCFCGLCTTVCPTECLTMTKAYDFSEYDVASHVYAFAEMTPLEILEKKQELEKVNKEKEAAKAPKAAPSTVSSQSIEPKEEGQAAPKPGFKPRVPMKPKAASPKGEEKPEADAQAKALEMMKAKTQQPGLKIEEESAKTEAEGENKPKPKPVFRPKVPTKPASPLAEKEGKTEEKELPNPSAPKPTGSRPVFKPKVPMKPKPAVGPEGTKAEEGSGIIENKSLKPEGKTMEPDEGTTLNNKTEADKESPRPEAFLEKQQKPKPVFRPKIPVKPKGPTEEGKNKAGEGKEETSSPKPDATISGHEEKATGNNPQAEGQKGAPKNPSEEKKPKPVYKPRPVTRKDKGKGEGN